ncbi:HAMP domain-containing histidine kinase [Pediococcus argentinicus]|uniref:Signal transduction histidine-protein kinase ArlS n=1 Tax=Pediococcus argentinicus TaxID=480391 RepID=A0A0R2NJ47_9LACO|nr:HAMP domain-containing histidine kinase [Pediococcus argentinicus]KRO25372.1 hypothetical protein IV88_GL000209 [Pediococcus argentinicus]NKZ22290.1 HAMP domain-containing histidine kinase [Pediococcus argentinicus]GEP19345.1 two-component sensor histidine kinase [Pediococcus argentinicus]
MENEERLLKTPRRISLKWKWAMGTGVGVLLIFGLFSFFIFRVIANSAYSQEHSRVESTMNLVSSRLQGIQKIDQKSVQILRPDHGVSKSPSDSIGPYSNSLIASLSRQDIIVSVYDMQGSTLFSSKQPKVDFVFPSTRNIRMERVNHNNYLVGRTALFDRNGKKIGFVQVVDTMREYSSTYHRLIWVFGLSTLLILLIISIFGYALAAYLLRPINLVHDTMVELGNDPQTDARIPKLNQNDELSDLADEFNNMIDRMQRYIDQQRQFVEDVSHELRTPVAVIEGHLKMLNRWGKDDPQILAESIESSLEETQRMKSLVSEMLDLTRADQIEINYANETTDVVKLFTQVFNDFKMIHPDFTFNLDNDIEGNPIVQIYRNHLEQVLIILLDNAVKYSVDRKEIHLSASSTSQAVEFAVQDFGEGISEESAKQVFNRFYRVDKARSRDKGGNGLGLSIAQRLIEEYGGTISLESSVGHGSIFRIQLPIMKHVKKDQ